MSLQQEIDARRAEIRTDSYTMSVGEMISLYKDEELDIHPESQRFHRWSVGQKSRFIESLLLGIPVPPIFVMQRVDGVWDVIDGLQRLSTILEFVGILRDENRNLKPPLLLEKTKYLPSLEGISWEDSPLSQEETHPTITEENAQPNTLTAPQRFLLKRAKLQVCIILEKNEEQTKYDLFQRFNRGEASLSSQALRNCMLLSINTGMYEWLRRLAQDENFVSCVSLADRDINGQYDTELVLSFLALRNLEEEALRNIGDITEFLTGKVQYMATSKEFDMEREGRYFTETFELLAKTTKSNSFRKYDVTKDKFLGGFLASAFEAVALGVGYNFDLIYREPIDIEDKIKQLWQTLEFVDSIGSDIRDSRRMLKTIPLSRRLFRP